jgi:hypothetical protein
LSRSPFGCDACGSTFLDYRNWDDQRAGAPSHLFARLHKGLTVDRRRRASDHRCALWGTEWKGNRAESPGQGTRIARHLWWDEPEASVVRPRDFTVEITRRPDEPVVSMASILLEIEATLRKSGVYSPPPVTFGSTRSADAMPVAAAAFWKTVNCYLSPHEFIKKRDRAVGVSSVVGDLPFDWPQASGLLLRAEVIGLLTRNILDMATSTYLAEVDWQTPIHPERYTPAWLLEQGSSSRASLTVRPVASSKALAWLIERKGKRLLRRSHFDRHLGTLIEVKDMYY